MSAREFIKVTRTEPVAMGAWVVAETPARIDLAGMGGRAV